MGRETLEVALTKGGMFEVADRGGSAWIWPGEGACGGKALQALTSAVANIVTTRTGNLRGVKACLLDVGEDRTSIARSVGPKAFGTNIYEVFSMFIPVFKTIVRVGCECSPRCGLIIATIAEFHNPPRMLT